MWARARTSWPLTQAGVVSDETSGQPIATAVIANGAPPKTAPTPGHAVP
jgi:hypothetical protein